MANLFQYIDRTAEQIEESLLQILPSELPEITDYEKDIFVRGLRIWANLAENLHYYIDNVARESNIESCRLFESAVRLARSYDYRVRCAIPCVAQITFTLSAVAPSNIIIPKGTVIETDEGIQYATISDATIFVGQTTVIATAYQQINFANEIIGVTSGLKNQTLVLPEDVADNSVTITIGSDSYTPVETFYYSIYTSKHFIQTPSHLGLVNVIFGDGVNGYLADANQNIVANYSTTLGTQGFVRANTLTNIISSITLPIGLSLQANNLNDATLGKDRQSVDEIKQAVKLQNRTVETAISRATYQSLGELAEGVAKAGISYEYGTTIKVYVIPIGGGVASQSFLDSVEAYYQNKIIICTRVELASAGEVRVLLDIDVEIAPNAIRTQLEQNIKNALIQFGSLENQEISGKMVSGNINQVVCNVEGVLSCVLNNFSIVPYGRPINNENALNWTVTLLENSTEKHFWKILFTSANIFQVLKNDVFAGNYNVGTLVEFAEVDFIINQNYSVNDEFTFVTYPFLGNKSGSFILDEPAILTIKANDIVLNLKGGV